MLEQNHASRLLVIGSGFLENDKGLHCGFDLSGSQIFGEDGVLQELGQAGEERLSDDLLSLYRDVVVRPVFVENEGFSRLGIFTQDLDRVKNFESILFGFGLPFEVKPYCKGIAHLAGEALQSHVRRGRCLEAFERRTDRRGLGTGGCGGGGGGWSTGG